MPRIVAGGKHLAIFQYNSRFVPVPKNCRSFWVKLSVDGYVAVTAQGSNYGSLDQDDGNGNLTIATAVAANELYGPFDISFGTGTDLYIHASGKDGPGVAVITTG